MAEIVLAGVSKSYGKNIRALVDLDLRVASGEWVAVVGPSGSGKTTMLRIIAGLEQPTGGAIQIAGKDMRNIAPDRRNVAMLFQRPALFPNKNVGSNLAFGLRINQGILGGWSERSRAHEKEKVQEVAHYLGIEPLLCRLPGQLSGGEQQRVALGRALIRGAAVALLDEPLGQLDAPLRLKLRRELPLLRKRFPATMMIVTHDPAEALALGDRIAVFNDGRLLQVDHPEKIRREPRHAFVAEFFG